MSTEEQGNTSPEVSVNYEKNKPNDKIKVFWYSDFLRSTGFGNVAEEIISRLDKTGKYDFTVLGINYLGEPYNMKGGKYYHLKDIPVYPAFTPGNPDMFGRQKFDKLLNELDFDILFILQDAFNIIPLKDGILDKKAKKKFKYAFYFPIDGDIEEPWVSEAIAIADRPVSYTQFGVDKVREFKENLMMDIIPHGADTDTFKPVKPELRKQFREEYFLAGDDEFVVVNVNRNQPRKDLVRSIMAFLEFNKQVPNSRYYLHCNVMDSSGHDLRKFIQKYVPENMQDKIMFPSPSELQKSGGLDKNVINLIYASADLHISTTLGEGWGLSTTEAMAAECPVIIPNNSSAPEIVGVNEERGYLVQSGETFNDYFAQKFDNNQLRPITNLQDLVKKMKHVYDNRDEAQAKAKAGREWLVKEMNWDKIVEKWDKLFTELYESKNKNT